MFPVLATRVNPQKIDEYNWSVVDYCLFPYHTM